MHDLSLLLALAPAVCGGHEIVHVHQGSSPADRAGAAVISLGDVDGDGTPDLAFGAPRAPLPKGTGEPVGSVAIVSGAGGRVLRVLRGEDPYDAFGSALAAPGDLDGDGRADLVVGAPAGTPPSGRVLAISGLDGSLLWSRDGRAAGERYGHALASVPDVDGDGRAEVLVGAPHDDGAGWNAGRVELLSGATGAPLLERAGAAGDFLGMSVAGLDDLDGDGRGELVVGAPFSDTAAFNSGSAYVLSGAGGATLRAFHGAAPGDQLGHAVASAGDADADGVPDVALAAPGADEGHLDAGAAEVRSGATGALLLRSGGGAEGVYLAAVAGLGDLDGDGADDVLVGIASASGAAGPECGRARVLSGRGGAVLLELEGRKTRDWFGAAVATAGDLDGDGRPELLIGAPVHDDEPGRPGRVEVLRATGLDGR